MEKVLENTVHDRVFLSKLLNIVTFNSDADDDDEED